MAEVEHDVTGPDGKVYTLTGPEGSTHEDAVRMAPQLYSAGKLRLKSTNKPVEPEEKHEKSLSWSEVPLDVVKGGIKGLATGIESFPGAMAGTMRSAGEFIESFIPETEGMRTSREKRQRFAEENPLPMLSSKLPSPEGAIGKTVESVAEAAPMAAASPGRAATRAAMAIGGGTGAEAGGAITGGPGGRFVGGLAGGGLAGGAEMGVSALRQQHVQPQIVAAKDFGRALTRDKITAEDLWKRLDAARKIRPDATVADVAGENVKGLIERIAQTPGAGRTTIIPRMTERQEGQIDRIATDLRGLTGTEQTARQAIKQTMVERAENSTPLYEQAYSEGDREIGGSVLEQLSGSPSVQRAMRSAINRWQDSAIADGYGAMNPVMTDQGGLIRFYGKIPAFPNVQFWDYTKRALDDMVRTARKAGATNKARDLTRLTKQLREAVDKQVPTYEKARNAWAGDQAYLDAIEEGKNIGKSSVTGEELRELMGSMSDAEKEGYRIGAVTKIINDMDTNTAKLPDRTIALRSRAMKEKIAAIMPDEEAARSWLQRLNYEVHSSELVGQSMRGSPTARRLAEMHEADSLVGDLVMSAFKGGANIGLLKKILEGTHARFRGTLKSKSDEILAEILTGRPAHMALSDVNQALRQPAGGSAMGALPGIAGTESNQPARQEGGPVTAGQPYTVGEQGAETFVPDQSGTIVPSNEAQSAREAAAGRMKRSVQPPEGRQEGLFTQMALESTPVGSAIGAYDAYQKKNYPEAGMLGLSAIAPAGGPLVRGAMRAAPKTAAAVGGLLGSTLLSSEGAESAKLTKKQQQETQMEQARIDAQSKAAIEEQKAKGASQVEMTRVQAEERRKELQYKSELQEKQVKEAENRRLLEEQRWKEASIREKYPNAATALSTAGIALSSILPYGIRMQKAFKEGQFMRDWSRTADKLESAIKKGDQTEARMYISQLSEFKKQATQAQQKASQVTNWMVGALTPLELSMLPEQADLVFGSEKAKGKAEEAILDWRRYPAGALQGAALSGLGVKAPLPPILAPHPQSTTARGAGLSKEFKKGAKKTTKDTPLSELVAEMRKAQ